MFCHPVRRSFVVATRVCPPLRAATGAAATRSAATRVAGAGIVDDLALGLRGGGSPTPSLSSRTPSAADHLRIPGGLLRRILLEHSEGERSASVHILDVGAVSEQLDRWKRALPRVRPFFAMKSNPHPSVIATLAKRGVGFDTASLPEIQQLLRDHGASSDAPLDPSRDIVFAHPIKQVSQLQAAFAMGVDTTVVDSVDELRKIATHAPHAKVLIRMATDDQAAVCQLSCKFGATLDEVPDLVRASKALGVNLVGIAFHVGSNCYEVAAYSRALVAARAAFDIAASAGIHLNLLDIGGGFTSPALPLTAHGYGADGRHVQFEDVATEVASALDRLFPQRNGSSSAGRGHDGDITIIAEPGRFFVEAAQTLATRVIGKRTAPVPRPVASHHDILNGAPSPRSMLFISESIYHSFNSVMYDHAVFSPVPVAHALLANGLPDEMFTRVLEGTPVAPPRAMGGVEAAPGVERDLFARASQVAAARYLDAHANHGAAATMVMAAAAAARAAAAQEERARALASWVPTSVWGQTCDGLDKIVGDIDLPASMQLGDWLVWPNAGAYTSAAASSFNGFEPSKVVETHMYEAPERVAASQPSQAGVWAVAEWEENARARVGVDVAGFYGGGAGAQRADIRAAALRGPFVADISGAAALAAGGAPTAQAAVAYSTDASAAAAAYADTHAMEPDDTVVAGSGAGAGRA